MPFAIAMTLVILVSSVVLLIQFWSGTLASEEAHTGGTGGADAAAPARIDTLPEPRTARPSFRADTAA
jgi:hypothetical protein